MTLASVEYVKEAQKQYAITEFKTRFCSNDRAKHIDFETFVLSFNEGNEGRYSIEKLKHCDKSFKTRYVVIDNLLNVTLYIEYLNKFEIYGNNVIVLSFDKDLSDFAYWCIVGGWYNDNLTKQERKEQMKDEYQEGIWQLKEMQQLFDNLKAEYVGRKCKLYFGKGSPQMVIEQLCCDIDESLVRARCFWWDDDKKEFKNEFFDLSVLHVFTDDE